MWSLRIIAVFLIYMISGSHTLRCTTSCSFQANLNNTFEIPQSCNEKTSVKYCAFRMSYYYRYSYSSLSFNIDYSNNSFNEYRYVRIDLSSSGPIGFYYSMNYECQNKDDCALDYAETKIPNLLRRLTINYDDMRNKLSPLLTTNLSNKDVDLSCFDSNENVRQCSIATQLGMCQAKQQLIGRRKTNRSCNYELYDNQQSVTISDMGIYASFDIKCNRSLCNGPMTLQAVKELMFNYSITETIEGRLNNGLRLSLSSFIFPILIIIILLS